MQNRFRHSKSSRYGFSLIELLVVIALMVVVGGIAVPNFNNIARGTKIGQAGQLLQDKLRIARQTAITRNRTVEVRFYQYTDALAGVGPSQPAFRSVQTFLVENNGQTTALDKVQALPNSIIMDGGPISTLLGSRQDKAGAWTSADPQVRIPQAGTNYQCRALRFYSDGSTSLDNGALWYVTLHEGILGDNLAQPPKNFCTLQVDPINGYVQVFRL